MFLGCSVRFSIALNKSQMCDRFKLLKKILKLIDKSVITDEFLLATDNILGRLHREICLRQLHTKDRVSTVKHICF